MSVALKDVELELGDLLQPELFSDYCPNGLQVEGSEFVQNLVTGVTACKALIDEAVNQNADLILVHHGYFWKGEEYAITGIKKDRIQKLLSNEISLMAYHLPLDVHPELGNNAQLGKILGFEVVGEFARYNNRNIGLVGKTNKAYTPSQLGEMLSDKLHRPPLIIEGGSKTISKVAWCTGAAQNYIEQAVESGADAYITGEISEPTVHIAREAGIHFFSAGHHATERFGVQAVGKYLADKFGLNHQFIDIDNPV
jgi:dinuclear metal center YbgI/SA1388 family protein